VLDLDLEFEPPAAGEEDITSGDDENVEEEGLITVLMASLLLLCNILAKTDTPQFTLAGLPQQLPSPASHDIFYMQTLELHALLEKAHNQMELD
jgi:hypothetical protein